MKLNKQYTSFLELDKDMEILQIKRKVHYQKILLDAENIKALISIEYLLSEAGKKVFEKYTNKSGNWVQTIVPFVLNIIAARRK